MKNRKISIKLFISIIAVAVVATSPGMLMAELEEITVTARKKQETLIDAPLAVSVFGEEELQNAGYTDILEISKATPGLFLEDYNQAPARVNTTPRFRGVFFSSGSRLLQTATVFLDGIYLSGGEQTIGVNELERVEIIKGPQSALFGRNTFSGAINYVTKDPTEEFRGDIDLMVASEDEYRVGLGIEGGITENILGRFSANFDHDGGDWSNNAVPGEELGDTENYAINGSLIFKPSERARIKLRGSYREVDDGTPAFIATAGIAAHNFGGFAVDANGVIDPNDSVIPGGGGRTESVFSGTITAPSESASTFGVNVDQANIDRFRAAYLGDPRLTPQAASLKYNVLNTNETGLQLDSTRFDVHADFDLTDNISLSFLGGYNEEAFGYWSDFDSTADVSFFSFTSQEIEDTSLEVRLSGSGDKFDWTLGASRTDIEILGVSGTANFFGPTIMFGGIFGTEPVTTGAITTGFFGSLDYRFTDQFSATLELRRAEDEISDGALSISPATINSTLPRFTVKYEPNDTNTVYATFSEGNLPGGFNPEIGELDGVQLAELAALAPGAGLTYEEESLTNYELGWKTVMADGSLSMNVAAFFMKREDEIFRSIELVTDTTPMAPNPFRTVAFTSNGAATDITGVEVDFTWAASDNFTMGGSLAYVDAEITSFPEGAGTGDFGDIFGSAANVEGQEAPRYAPVQISLNGTYEQACDFMNFNSWYTRGDVLYNSKYYDSVANTTELDAATEANLRFGLRGDNLTAELFVTNLFDEDSPTAGSNFADISNAVRTRPGGFFDFSREGTTVGLRDKRQVGVRLKYNF